MKKQLNYIRPIDRLGRVVIPKEMRQALGISVNEALVVSLENDRICITRKVDTCALCGNTTDLIPVCDKFICKNCRSKLLNTSENG